MTAARFNLFDPDGVMTLGDCWISGSQHTSAVVDAAAVLTGAPAGIRIQLWKDVDLVRPLADFGEPHADLLMGHGGWIRVLPEAVPGGQHGGDRGVSDAVSSRWIKPIDDKLWAVVTCAFYVASETDDLDDGPFVIECESEYLVCTDPFQPGDTEEWADSRYTLIGGIAGPDGADGALVEAVEQAEAPHDEEWNEYAEHYRIG
jgi:hypothetical protein